MDDGNSSNLLAFSPLANLPTNSYWIWNSDGLTYFDFQIRWTSFLCRLIEALAMEQLTNVALFERMTFTFAENGDKMNTKKN